MNLLNVSKGIFIVTIMLLYTACQNTNKKEDGWTNLFDGKTLNGWKILNQDWTHADSNPDFYVENGMIISKAVLNTDGGYLVTEKMYSNFILELDVKVDSTLNSGIQCRGQIWEKDTATTYVAGNAERTVRQSKWRKGYVWGYQIEIDPSKRAWSGGLYEPGNRGWVVTLDGNEKARQAFKNMEWNHFKVKMDGNRIQSWVNDIPVVDTVDDMSASGFIGLQYHGVYSGNQKDKTTMWKNIRIKEL